MEVEGLEYSEVVGGHDILIKSFFLEEGVSLGVDQSIETQLEFVAESDFSNKQMQRGQFDSSIWVPHALPL
jgi:hypothetical protein